MKKIPKKIISFFLCTTILSSLLCISSVIQVSAASYTWPVSTDYGITNGYTGSNYNTNHTGADFACPIGTPIYAVASGTVITAVDRGCLGSHRPGGSPQCSNGSACGAWNNNGNYGSYGNYIYIQHTDGVVTRYCHLNTGRFAVSSGQTVQQGQLIGYSGCAGNATGPHLHFEFLVNGTPNNPANYLSKVNPDPNPNPFPGEEDTSWDVPTTKTAKWDLSTYNDWGVEESGHWISAGDPCYIEKVYQNGYVRVNYPLDGGGDRWAYAQASGFSLEKKGNDPAGVVDSVTGEQGAIHIHGWAFDDDDRNAQLNIHVYIGGSAGDSNAEGHNQTWANDYRPDVNNVYGCGDYHGYDDTIRTSKTGNQTVYIYAINVGNGNNKLLGESTVYISPDTEAPTISDVTVSGVSPYGFRVTCRVSDASGISKVQFPTWTSNNGQDDLGEWPVANVKGNTATIYIKSSDHNNETGEYIVHIYATDNFGNQSSTGIKIAELTNNPEFIESITYNGNTYKVFNSGMSWSNAKAWCETNGGHLATATSSSEWNAIKNLLQSFKGIRCWLGAEETNGSWQWVTSESFVYQDWANNQPDCANGTEHYLGSFGDNYLDCYKWNDYTVNASDVGGFVCEYEDTVEPQKAETIFFKGHTYEIYNIAFSWDKAKEWCERKGGHLATLSTKYEWENLKATISTKDNMNYWLGADASSGSWQWVTGEPFEYSHWGIGQPDNSGGNEKYLGSYYSSKDNDCVWNDYIRTAFDVGGFVCEYDGTNEPQKISELTYNDHIYEIYNADLNWLQAQEWCQANKGNLAVFTDESEWLAVKSHLSDNNITNCWLGADCESGNWHWVTGESFSFADWAEGQPDNYNGKELYLGTFGKKENFAWNDYTVNAIDIGSFILEKEITPPYVSGDINSDSKVNMKDLVLLQQYLNNWDVTINEKAANVNGDSKINMKDLVLLQQYLNNWDVELS